MAENNNVQNVKIMASEVNLRATSLRARITDVVSMYKLDNNSDEFRIAMQRFNEAVTAFAKVII